MGPYELRPLSLGELLDRAFALYRRNFWLFAGIMAIPACLVAPARAYYLRSYGIAIPWNRMAPQPRGAGVAFGLSFFVWLVYAIAQAATTYAIADVYLGRPVSVTGSYARIRGRFWRIIGVSFNVGFRLFGMLVLFVIAAVIAGGALIGVSRGAIPNYVAGLIVLALMVFAFALAVALALRYMLALPAVLIEEIKGSASIRRSVLLSDGRRGQIFLAFLLGLLLFYAVIILFEGPFYAVVAMAGVPGPLSAPMAVGMAVSGSVGAAVAGPVLMIILVVFYYDMRIRKEAFDLQQMMASLPEASPAASASTA